MSDFDWLAQGVGILASAIVIFSFSQKSDNRFKVFLIAGAFAFAFHYILMGALAAAFVAVVNGIRSFCSIKFHGSDKIMIAFILFYISSIFFVYERPYDLLPVFSGVLSTFALYKLQGIKMRVSFFFAESSWLVFSILINSIGGIITNVFVLATNSITTYRLVRDSKNETHR
ncbi:MAG: YgjV family protein [Pseudomonadota bacterium]